MNMAGHDCLELENEALKTTGWIYWEAQELDGMWNIGYKTQTERGEVRCLQIQYQSGVRTGSLG